LIVLAHRGNLDGPDRKGENAFETVAAALERGFGVETDLRFLKDGTPYISHDPVDSPSQLASDHAALWARYPRQLIALNVKEIGFEAETISLLRQFRRLENTVLFDMELIEPRAGQAAIVFQALESRCELAARVSDRGETIDRALSLPGDYVWLDEMDGEWVQRADVARLKNAGRKILAVSRDLHGAAPDACEKRWAQLAEWGVDGICTDWPKRLLDRLNLRTS
jgi:glycerophosphoryl diester phosphodiesterase